MSGKLRLSFFCLLAISLISCGGGSDPTLTSVDVTPAQVTLANVGDTAQLKATGNYVSSSYSQTRTTKDLTGQVKWESVNPAVASVDASGKVTAVGQGTTSI